MKPLHTVDLEAAREFFEAGGESMAFSSHSRDGESYKALTIARIFVDEFIVAGITTVFYRGKDLEEAVKAYNEAK